MHDMFAETVGSFARLGYLLPSSYVDLIIGELRLRTDDRVLDLGCGTGELARRISSRGMNVTAVDRSRGMLREARAHSNSTVVWIESDVHDFDDTGRYRAVYSYESFHLFSDPEKVVSRIKRQLAFHGTFAIGWRLMGWEVDNASMICDAFAHWGAPLHDWAYWTCPQFADWLDDDWITSGTLHVSVAASTTVEDAADFLCSIERALKLDRSARQGLRADLLCGLSRNAKCGKLHGHDRYGLNVSRLAH